MKIIFLDTETTGLNPSKDGLVEIAIADINGTVLLNTLVNPERPIGFASSIHNITDDMVATAPTLDELWPKVQEIVSGNHLVIYNAQFDTKFFPDNLACAAKVSCAMLKFAKIYGEKSNKPGGYKWQKLVNAADYIGYEWEGNAHRALADVNATRAVWQWMENVQKNTPAPSPKKTPSHTQKSRTNYSATPKTIRIESPGKEPPPPQPRPTPTSTAPHRSHSERKDRKGLPLWVWIIIILVVAKGLLILTRF